MAKFSQHECCKRYGMRERCVLLMASGRKLLESGTAIIVAILKSDPYWATDGNGNGRNRLGEMLMTIRGQLAGRFPPAGAQQGEEKTP